MSEKQGTSLDKRPFIIIILITLFLILLVTLTFFAYQMGRQAGQQTDNEKNEGEKEQTGIATTIAELSPFGNNKEDSEETAENQIGTVRANPWPAGSIIDMYNWRIEVLDFERGEAAWQSLHSAHPHNQLPPDGQEYLNLKLRVKNNNLEEEFLSYGLTGDALIKYYSHENDLISQDPWLERSVPARTELEGWDTFVIQENEDNLMLVFDIGDYEDPPVYLALEANTSIPFDHTMVNITRTDLGIEPAQPVPFGQTATGEDWQISVIDVVQGEVAWQQILETNQFNDPPEAGREYIMVKLNARYIGLNDEGDAISYSPFSIRTNSGNEFKPASVVEPEPSLDYNLYPGGEAAGWIVLSVPEQTKNLMLFFSPDSSGANDRYLSLGQGR